MRTIRTRNHPLSRSLEHFFGIAGVLLVALVVGSYASALKDRTRDQLAQTASASDTSLPTPPNTIRATPLSQTQVEVTWDGASDNARVMGYRIYRDGNYFFGTTQTKYTDTAVLPGETHTYTIVTVDTANNASQASEQVSVTLPSADGSGGTPGVSVPATTSLLGEVGFSVTVSPAVSCDGGRPLTSVFLLVTKTEGGDFVLNSDNGILNAQMEWGEYPLPNGNYTWRGRAKSGYVAITDSNGSFTIAGTCPGMATTSTPTVGGGAMAPEQTNVSAVKIPPAEPMTGPPVLPRPQLKLFINDRPADLSKAILKDEIELRVTTAVAKHVVFYREKPTPEREIGVGVEDDLLSIAGLDVYSFIWDPEKDDTGTVVLYARVFHEDGRTTETERLTVKIGDVGLDASMGRSSTGGSGEVAAPVRILTRADRETILSRVADPSTCSNADECKIFCGTGGSRELCADFAREETMRVLAPASFADDIAAERLAVILLNNDRVPKELPEAARTPETFLRYCEDLSNEMVCQKTMVANDLAAPEALVAKREKIINDTAELRRIFSERVGARAYVDSDGDGVPDYDEINLYRTSPVEADTDRDGFPDGVELLARTNPRGGMPMTEWSKAGTSTQLSPDESMMREDPHVAGLTDTEMLHVSDVHVEESKPDNIAKEQKMKIVFGGKALANTFVTLYIFSDPIVVAVKTDHTGAWSYTLDKDLADGTHEVFSAVTDASGRIITKSAPIAFVKESGSVALAAPIAGVDVPESGFFSGNGTVATLAVILGLFGIALSIIGIVGARFNKNKDHVSVRN